MVPEIYCFEVCAITYIHTYYIIFLQKLFLPVAGVDKKKLAEVQTLIGQGAGAVSFLKHVKRSLVTRLQYTPKTVFH